MSDFRYDVDVYKPFNVSAPFGPLQMFAAYV